MSPLPKYVSWLGHGATEFPAPATFSGTSSYVFFAKGNSKAMQATVDRLLKPAAGDVKITVPFPWFFTSFMDMARCTSSAEPNVGWLPGREWAIWIPVLVQQGDALPRPYLWAPYICIDYTIGLVTGRETWGWPKSLGRIVMPEVDTEHPARFDTHTTIFRTLSPDTPGEQDARLISVKSANALSHSKSSFIEKAHEIERLASMSLGGLISEILDFFGFAPKADTLVLKQFRDSLQQDKACYQKLVASPVQFSNFQGMGLLDGDYEICITSCESHKIVEDLTGQAPQEETTSFKVEAAVHARFDFAALPGPEIT
jgi:hypothetical protein